VKERAGVAAEAIEMAPLLEVTGVHKNFGGVVALDGVDLALPSGDLACVIGPNGCGKTTLLNVVSGAFAPDGGKVWFRGEDITGLAPTASRARGSGANFRFRASILLSLWLRISRYRSSLKPRRGAGGVPHMNALASFWL
jgi:ABC-type uncharacterized transport system ATPase subunit